jgi:DNA-binding NarL/FixJ family response regulator
VLIYDDDPVARRAIVEAFEEADGISVRGRPIADTESADWDPDPDVVVLDAITPALGGAAQIRRILSTSPGAKVVVLDSHYDEGAALVALRSGADGYLPKRIDLAVLPRVLRAVAKGEAGISRSLTSRLIAHLHGLPVVADGERPLRGDLTQPDWELIDGLAAGRSSADLAAKLGISVQTVRSRIRQVFRKLGVPSRAEAIVAAEELRRASRDDGEAITARPGGGSPGHGHSQ